MNQHVHLNDNDEIRPEYDFSHGVRGKHYEAYRAGTNVVFLDPDVAQAFADSASVNQALRLLLQLARKNVSLDRQPAKGARPTSAPPRSPSPSAPLAAERKPFDWPTPTFPGLCAPNFSSFATCHSAYDRGLSYSSLITRHMSLLFAAPTSPFGKSQTPKGRGLRQPTQTVFLITRHSPLLLRAPFGMPPTSLRRGRGYACSRFHTPESD